MVVFAFLLFLYSLFALVSSINLLLMTRPNKKSVGNEKVCILIPARNEEDNLKRLIPLLTDQCSVFVFNDDSSDDTASVITRIGAQLVESKEPLPQGWTGKNWGCYHLAQAAMAAHPDADWLLFLDADTYPSASFVEDFLSVAEQSGGAKVISGFPQIRHGVFPEPMALGWVAWILLATAPFGLVSKTGKGHTRFTNGQIHAWKPEIYRELNPNKEVSGDILEDVKMGRLCAKRGVRVEVANFSSSLGVQMYQTFREALNGMTKNSYEIAGSIWGTFLLASAFLIFGFAWMFAGSFWWICAGLLLLSSLNVCLTVRANLLYAPALPLSLAVGSFTLLRSLVWHRTGKVVWKDRVYDTSK